MPGERGAGGIAGGFAQSIGGRAFDLLRQGVGACVESGDIRTASIDLSAQALWAGVHGLTTLLVTEAGPSWVHRAALVDHTIDTLIAGLRTPAPAAPRTAVQPKSKKWDFMD